MKFILFLSTLIFCLNSYSQDSILISGHFKHNKRFAKVEVSKFGVGNFPIARASIQNEKMNIVAPGDIEPGVYRFQYSQTASDYIDIIINGKEKEIAFSLDIIKENKTPQFSKSTENQLWYNYQNQSQTLLQKIELLHQFLTIYPNASDKILVQARQAYEVEKQKYIVRKSIFLKNNPATWAALIEQNKPYYFTNPKDDWRIQNLEKHNHFWDQINTNNPILITSPLYTELILKYLKYYMNHEMGFSEVEMNQGLIKSVDTIMTKFSGNDATQKFALQYLQKGFIEIDKEEVLQYIDQKYQAIAEQCEDVNAKTAYENRMVSYAALKLGNFAPNIVFSNKSTLYEIKAEQTLVVFWASWCPHCQEELPKVNAWAKEHPEIKVVAISLDDDKAAFDLAIKELSSLIHYSDLKKWNGKVVKDYYINGTPTYIFLDKSKKIIKKFSLFDLSNLITI